MSAVAASWGRKSRVRVFVAAVDDAGGWEKGNASWGLNQVRGDGGARLSHHVVIVNIAKQSTARHRRKSAQW